MRIVAIVDVAEDVEVIEASVAHLLKLVDAVVAVVQPGSDGTRDLLAAFCRQDEPLVVVDLAIGNAGAAHAAAVEQNTRRFFRPSVLLRLTGREVLTCTSRAELEGVLSRRTALGEVSVHPSTVPARQVSAPRQGSGPSWSISPAADHRFWQANEVRPGPSDAAAAGLASGVLPLAFHTSQFYLDLPPFRYLADKYCPGTVLDVGCGLGGYLAMFRHWGAGDVHGVDGNAETGPVLCRDAYSCHDLREPFDLQRRFDLVICTEVVEHLPVTSERDILESIERHARELIVFSAARPGQPGVGHVNCQPVEHWIAAWHALGWEPDPFDTITVRSLSTYFWFRRNLLVLRRTGRVPGRSKAFGPGDLLSYEADEIAWVGQQPKIHVFAFEEPVPVPAS